MQRRAGRNRSCRAPAIPIIPAALGPAAPPVLLTRRPPTPTVDDGETVAESTTTASPVRTSINVRRGPASTCGGDCFNLACADVVQANGAANAATWLVVHHIMGRQKCPKHPDAATRQGPTEGVRLCAEKVSNRTCGTPVGECAFFSLQQNRDNSCDSLLDFLRLVAAKTRLTEIARQMSKHRHTITDAYYAKLISACAQYQDRHFGTHKFTDVQIDETYFGKRKYNAGKNVRRQHHWAVSFTWANDTVWHLVRARDAETLSELIRRHVAPEGRATVTTDGWRGYRQLDKIPGVVEHHVVVHKRVGQKHTFVTKEGRHTNNAESAHASVKKTMKSMFYHYGKASKVLQANMTIGTLFFNKDAAERLRVLLIAVSEWDGKPWVFEDFDEIEDPSDAELSESSGDDVTEETATERTKRVESTPAAKKSHRHEGHNGDTAVRVDTTAEVAAPKEVMPKKAAPKKAAPKKAAPKKAAPQRSVEAVREEDMELTQRERARGLSYIRAQAYASVMTTTAEFDDYAVELLMRHVLRDDTDYFLCPPHWDWIEQLVFPKDRPCIGALVEHGHWVLYTWRFDRGGAYHEIEEYNSAARTAEPHGLVKLKQRIRESWGDRRVKMVSRDCPQQGRHSNDCGLSCINVAASLTGTLPLTREECAHIILEGLHQETPRK
jgi:IS1 family transposase